MGIKKYKPTSPARRQMTVSDKDVVTAETPHRPLTEHRHRAQGRNNHGRITSRFRGGGHKRRFRAIDFKRDKYGVPGKIATIEYDPNRTAFIALINYDDGEQAYIIAPQRLAAGDKIVSSMSAVDVKPGNTMPLERMPVGTIVHNIELKPRKGAQVARSAGAYAQYVGRDQGWAVLRLNSGEQRRVHGSCLATVGAVSNQDHSNTSLGKAGRSRWLGRKPVTRGVAMNPIDHPHGGGEGRTSGGRHPVTPWGKPTKGKKTRSNKATDKFIVRSRHVKKGR
jgi:large subunit ribosomal protein L2